MSNNKFGNSGKQYVTIRLAGQLFGLPIDRVQDVFMPDNFTFVPLAETQIAGVLNLRGRILTAIDLSKVLNVAAVNETNIERPAISVIYANELYGLLIDIIGEVVTLDSEQLEANPVNLDAEWAKISVGTYRLEDELLVILDIDVLIEELLNKEAA
ncbi:MAG: chemotaxis protein CheW [Devosiaceae bacterium]|nr:chemotaxis protein CheW [Devosiaceae bacterium]